MIDIGNNVETYRHDSNIGFTTNNIGSRHDEIVNSWGVLRRSSTFVAYGISIIRFEIYPLDLLGAGLTFKLTKVCLTNSVREKIKCRIEYERYFKETRRPIR